MTMCGAMLESFMNAAGGCPRRRGILTASRNGGFERLRTYLSEYVPASLELLRGQLNADVAAGGAREKRLPAAIDLAFQCGTLVHADDRHRQFALDIAAARACVDGCLNLRRQMDGDIAAGRAEFGAAIRACQRDI